LLDWAIVGSLRFVSITSRLFRFGAWEGREQQPGG
jgi:hypothetical protein